MASNVDQNTIYFGNNDAAIMNGKNTNRNEVDKKKTALGDIKNAQSLNSGEKLSVKTVHVEASEDDSGNEFASSKAVDYHKVWVERVTLTDNEIDRWVTMLNAARNINPYDETKPLPIPEEDIHFEESQHEEFDMEPVPLIPFDPTSLSFNSLDSFIGTEAEEHPSASSFYNDTEMSDLNRSVFELSSEFDEYF